MRQLLLILLAIIALGTPAAMSQSLQDALNLQGFSINVLTDEIDGEVFFQQASINARIVFQESSQLYIEAMGWYTSQSAGEWLIGGAHTSLPFEAPFPDIGGQFGLKFHPNYTGEGFINEIWYSEPALNVDQSDHAKVFYTKIGGQIVPYSYVVAWEDLSQNGQGDFQDMIVRLDGVIAVDGSSNPVDPPPPSTSLQHALDIIGYTVNTGTDEIPGEVYFQKLQSNAAIVYQESSQLYEEAFGWYSGESDNAWIIGGASTGLPTAAFLPEISGTFGFQFHPNYTGDGFITNGPFYTERALNPGGTDRAKVFPTSVDGQIVPYSYLICWEDWTDGDFQDMIVRVDWVQPVTPQASTGSIAGAVTLSGAGVAHVPLDLLDGLGNPIAQAMSGADGSYSFSELPAGAYSVMLTPPLGFSADEEVKLADVNGGDVLMDFALSASSVNRPQHVWWWKTYLDDLRCDGPRADQFTVADVNEWGQRIFDHFYDRIDGLGIEMDQVTYLEGPPRPLNFGDICEFMLDGYDGSYEYSLKANMLTNMLNVASGRMSQLAVVTADGVTLSQAITWAAEVYELNAGWVGYEFDKRNALIRAYRALRDIAMGTVLPCGIIPVETPLVLYRQGQELDGLPEGFGLAQNYPNPFNPTTQVLFTLPYAQQVRLDVFNTLGQRVSTLVDEFLSAGDHLATWDGTGLASGIYFYHLAAQSGEVSRKMMLVK